MYIRSVIRIHEYIRKQVMIYLKTSGYGNNPRIQVGKTSFNKFVIYERPGSNMGKVVMNQLPGKLQNLNDTLPVFWEDLVSE